MKISVSMGILWLLYKIKTRKGCRKEEKMITFLPKTVLGKWSVALIVMFFLSLAAFHFCLRDSDAEKLLAHGITAVTGVAAFVAGIIGVVKSKEASILVLLFFLPGLGEALSSIWRSFKTTSSIP